MKISLLSYFTPIINLVKKVESNFSYQSEDSEYSTTVVSNANYDSTGKMVSFLNKAAFDGDELKPSEKLIFEYKYYDDEG